MAVFAAVQTLPGISLKHDQLEAASAKISIINFHEEYYTTEKAIARLMAHLQRHYKAKKIEFLRSNHYLV